MKTAIKWIRGNRRLAYGCLSLLLMPVSVYSLGFAIIAKQGILLQGTTYIDSFNSTDPNYSTNGGYVLARHTANANVMSLLANTVGSVSLTSGHIFGHVYCGAGSSIQTGGGSIGNTNYSGFGIQVGWKIGYVNFMVPDAPPLPNVSWVPVNVHASVIVLKGGSYRFAKDYSLASAQTIIVTNGAVVLDLQGQFSMQSSSKIVVATNASLVIWLNGNPTLAGSPAGYGIINQTGNATNVTIYGTTNCTSIYFSPPSDFIGTVYAPHADVSLFGSFPLIGSIVANSFYGDSAVIHYDEALPSPPWLLSPPLSKAITAGSNTSFTISAAGSDPLQCQWLFNQTNQLASGTNAWSLTNAQPADTGNYSVVVTNPFGAVTSAPAVLFVYTNADQLAAQLDAPPAPANDQMQLSVGGVAGLDYALQASSNLVKWTTLATNVSPFVFADTNAGLYPRRFYRAVNFP